MIVVGTLSYISMGLICLVVGMRMRRGIGRYRISRRVFVHYEELPLKERIKTSNSLLVFGVTLLACATYSKIPDLLMAAFFVMALFFFVLYTVVQRDLRTAAQAVVRSKTG